MQSTTLPKMNMDASETGCCPKFDPSPWDLQEFVFDNKLFAKATTVNFMHIPLNMGSMFKKAFGAIQKANAMAPEFLVLSTDPSPWKGAHYFAVSKDVDGLEMTHLSGTFMTKVFEGPFSDARKWVSEMSEYVGSAGKKVETLYFFYTTCPKCAKHFGKNYVVAFAKV